MKQKQVHRRYTIQEVQNILNDHAAGLPVSKIGKKYGRSSMSIYSFLYEYKLWKKTGKAKSNPLTVVFNTLYKNNHEDKQTSSITPPQTDPFIKIETTLQAFLEEVIEVAKKQSKDQTEKQLKEQKERYEKELLHYQELLIIAKDTNMVGFIKKKLGLPNNPNQEGQQ